MSDTDDLAALLIRVDLQHGRIVSHETFSMISLSQARRIVAAHPEFDLVWWTTRKQPFVGWRIILKS